MNTKEKAELMLAFDRGEVKIEAKCAGFDWYIVTDPIWNWKKYTYRAKPQIKKIDLRKSRKGEY